MSAKVCLAQYGTRHAHAAGKMAAMLHKPQVEVAGVYEPDPERRRQLSQERGPYREVRWFEDPQAMLGDRTIAAIASEGCNAESLDQTEAIVAAGKHVWYDKPAGEDWGQWQRVVAAARERSLLIQMGYMFRYHHGFRQITAWARSGLLGQVYAVRAQMSTCLPADRRRRMAVHQGGIFYDLAGHMLDQIVWLLGRPVRVTPFLRNDSPLVPGFVDNSLVVLEYEQAMACVEIAAMEPRPVARRYEVYGGEGSAILVESFEPAHRIRLCLDRAREGYREGEQFLPVLAQTRQGLYELELEAFLAAIAGEAPPDRSPDHELLVQETLLRGTGVLL